MAASEYGRQAYSQPTNRRRARKQNAEKATTFHPNTIPYLVRRAKAVRFAKKQANSSKKVSSHKRPKGISEQQRSTSYTTENRGKFKEEQIVGTQEKPQWIVAQRLLSHLQYLDATKSSAKDLSPAQFNL
jgi:hypothetical protein